MSVCVYLNCKKTKHLNPETVFHHIPSVNRIGEDLLQKWITNCGNPVLLNISPKSLKKKVVCADHFRKQCYLSDDSNSLRRDAVPEPSASLKKSPEHLKVLTPRKTYGIKRKLLDDFEDIPFKKIKSESENVHILTPSRTTAYATSSEANYWTVVPNLNMNTPTKRKRKSTEKPSDSDCATIRELKSKIIALKKEVIYISKKNNKIKNYNKNLKVRSKGHNMLYSILSSFHFKSEEQKTLIKMQLLHTKKGKWSMLEKQFALSLYYRAPNAYRHLLQQKINLPSVATIKSWIQSSKFLPGFNSSYLNQLKIRVGFMEEREKACILAFDEMSIKKWLVYNKALDIIEGFEDLGLYGRSNKIAREALVFMSRGLYSRWKLPVAYFMSGSQTAGTIMVNIVRDMIGKLNSCGLIVKAIVCDQGTNNQKCFKLLGVTKETPYFSYENQKIFAMYDVPHLIKSIRNNLVDAVYVLENKIISLKDVEALLKIDSANYAQSLLKITSSHLHPNAFEKLSVKLASQLFSKRVAAALKTAISTGEVKSETAAATAEFIELMDRTFDCLNSNLRFAKNKFKSAISDENPHIREALLNTKEKFEKLTKEKISYMKTGRKIKTSRPPCFDGVVQTINAVLLLHDQEKEIHENNYLLTARLNQDVNENLFSVIRQRGGYCRNPSVQRFRCTFRQVTINSLLRSAETSNCEEDNDFFLSVDDSLLVKKATISSPDLSNPSSVECRDLELSSNDDQEDEDICVSCPETTNLETCSMSMFAGYCGAKLFKNTNCLKCKKVLLSDDKMQEGSQDTLIFYRNYEKRPQSIGLCAPTETGKLLCHIALSVFKKHFKKRFYKRKVKQTMCNRVLAILKNKPETSLLCTEHIKLFLNILFNAKLYSYCKSVSRDLTCASKKALEKRAKLNIFKNV